MSVLPDADLAEVYRQVSAALSEARLPCAATKPQVKAAIAGLDSFVDTNATAINQAIPNGARTALTNKQKALCLAYVCLKRYGVI